MINVHLVLTNKPISAVSYLKDNICYHVEYMRNHLSKLMNVGNKKDTKVSFPERFLN